MLESIAGHAMPHYGITGTFSLAPGDEPELHDELAAKWISSGIAERAETSIAAGVPAASPRSAKKSRSKEER
ncbi:MAG TPA: hypothetical protein VGT04_07095 [Acidobacteriaceae bacterium]|nr:hypothetical protein [Acidobacteriaceae bacterium]